jgi:hypothetical protein
MSGRLRRHAGVGQPRRLERAVLAVLAVLLALVVLASALSLRLQDQLNLDSPRGVHFAYLLVLTAAVWLTLRWPRLSGVLAMLALVEVALGVGARLVFGTPPLPDNASIAQRFRWHILLQATPVPSLALTTANDKTFRHTSQGTRGRELGPQELAGKTVIAVFGGSSTYDIGVSDEETWTNRLEQAIGPTAFAVVNHGVPGYSTVEHLIQTAFYQTKFGQPPACAVYYVGWNDIRNAHFRNLDPAYADFHLPSQVDSMRTRRVGGAHVSISPLLTVVGRFASAAVDTVQYSSTLSGEIKSGGDPALEALYARNVRAISAINRERRIKTVWIAQLLNRDRLAASGGMYGWLPYVRDRDLWPLQARFNEILREAARGLDDAFVDAGVENFTIEDFIDEGHFTPAGAVKFANRIAPAVGEACR